MCARRSHGIGAFAWLVKDSPFPSDSPRHARLIRIPAIARVMRIYISIASAPNSALYTISLGKFNFFNQQGDTTAGATTTAPALEQNAMLFFDSNGLRADFAQKSYFCAHKKAICFRLSNRCF